MYHLGEVRWRQGQREAAATLLQQSLEIMEAQVGGWVGGRGEATVGAERHVMADPLRPVRLVDGLWACCA